jgi:hypothetical protein
MNNIIFSVAGAYWLQLPGAVIVVPTAYTDAALS